MDVLHGKREWVLEECGRAEGHSSSTSSHSLASCVCRRCLSAVRHKRAASADSLTARSLFLLRRAAAVPSAFTSIIIFPISHPGKCLSKHLLSRTKNYLAVPHQSWLLPLWWSSEVEISHEKKKGDLWVFWIIRPSKQQCLVWENYCGMSWKAVLKSAYSMVYQLVLLIQIFFLLP